MATRHIRNQNSSWDVISEYTIGGLSCEVIAGQVYNMLVDFIIIIHPDKL